MAKHNDKALGALIADLLPAGDKLETKVADKVFPIDPRELPNNAIIDLLRYGTQRRFNDATGGSDKTPADKHAKVEEMIGNYRNGVVSQRKAGTGVNEEQKVARQIALQLVKKQLDREVYKQEFTDAETSVRNEKLDKIIAKNSDRIAGMVKQEMERRAAAAKAVVNADVDLGDIL